MTHTMIDKAILATLIEHAGIVAGDLQYDGRSKEHLTYLDAVTTAHNLITNPTRPKVVVNITGGVVQGWSSDYPIDFYYLDYDIDCPMAADSINIEEELASCGSISGDINFQFVAEVERLYLEITNGHV